MLFPGRDALGLCPPLSQNTPPAPASVYYSTTRKALLCHVSLSKPYELCHVIRPPPTKPSLCVSTTLTPRTPCKWADELCPSESISGDSVLVKGR